MSDPQAVPDDRNEVEALGADPDMVSSDRDPEPDQVPGVDDADGDSTDDDAEDDEVEVSDLP